MHPDALDPAHIASLLPSAAARDTEALNATQRHLSTHGGYVAWSGGKDSTAVVHLAHRVAPDTPVVWFNSGLEYPDTQPYIEALATHWGINLHIIDATPDALTIMEQTGAWDHAAAPDWNTPTMHEALITEPARTARARYGHAELWGLRAGESVARRALLTPGQGYLTRRDGTHVTAPIWRWRDIDLDAYNRRHHIPENPAYTRLRAAGATGKDLRVGLAVDGNNLNHGRIIWLRRCYPDLYRRLEQRLPRLREWS